jgi:hypothetical protein
MLGIRRPRVLARLCTVASVVALVLPMLAASALATEPDCARLDVTYLVDGEKVKHVHGNVGQGSTVEVQVTIPEGCDPVELTLASHESPQPKFDKDQVLYDHETGQYEGTVALHVDVPDCYFQVDFAYGSPVYSFAGGEKYGRRLIDAAIGGRNTCASSSPSPSPTETPSVSESPSPPAESPSESETPTPSPTPTETSSGPEDKPTPADTPSSVHPSDEGPVGGGADHDDDEDVTPAPRSRLATTGLPVLVVALLGLLGIGLGTTLLHTTRRRRAG